METALELDDALAPGERAGDAERGLRCLGPRIDEAQLPQRRDQRTDLLGQHVFPGGRRPEARSQRRCFGDGLHDGGMRMSGEERAPGEHVVDVPVAVLVVEPRLLAARDEQRVAGDSAERAHRRVHAAGEQRFRARELPPGTVGLQG